MDINRAGTNFRLAIRDHPPTEWKGLTIGSHLFATSRWLEATIGRLEGDHRWLVLMDGKRPVVGLVGTIIGDPRGYAATNLHVLLHSGLGSPPVGRSRATEARGPGPPLPGDRPDDWVPNLVCTYPGYASFLVGPEPRSEPAVRQIVLATIEWAENSHLRAVAFPYVGPDESLLCQTLAQCGFRGFPVTSRAELQLPGHSFDDYLSSLSTNHRKQVQRDLRLLQRSGVTTTARPLSECMDDVLRLRLAHRAKYGHHVSKTPEQVNLVQFQQVFGDDAVAFCSQVEDKIVSFCLILKDPTGVWYALMTGSDYSDPRARYAYFATNYYRPVLDAYRGGVRSIAYGLASEEAKRRRGCRLVPVQCWIYTVDRELQPYLETVLGGDITPGN